MTNYNKEPFKNIRIQYSDDEQHVRIEFSYNNTNIAFRTKASGGHGAYAWSDTNRSNCLDGMGLHLVDENERHVIDTVFEYFLSSAKKLHSKCYVKTGVK